ncbi:MAG: PspC domain-containing protein [Bacteroidales bacterium]|nr:PspC domain-containing protein [Bacteroidales bacterium]
MKKTISVNLSGSIFILDDDAYQVLDEYLKQLDRHFASVEGKQEILADIEARIAEHLKAAIRVDNQVVSVDEIRRIVGVMGYPNDIDDTTVDASYNQSSRSYRRLYRDLDSKVLGGVCSGIGHYWRVEPVLFRIIFVLTLFWGGLGLLIYLVLWIVVPPALTASQKLEMQGESVNAENIGKSFDNKK